MKKCSVGGQAVLEGVMMKSPDAIAMAVRRSNGEIVTDYKLSKSKAQKGTFWGLPIVRGVVSFVESLSTGMKTLTRSAELFGEEIEEEPSKFEKWLERKFGKSAEKVIIGFAVFIAILLSVGLFILLPTFLSDLIFAGTAAAPIWRSLAAGGFRLLIFVGYIIVCSQAKDVSRVFMYHGAEHKTIACYEADEELTPENAVKHSRLHPRCGTNDLFLVMAVSILFFAAIGWSENKLILFGTRILFLPLVAGLSYEVLKLAAKSDNILCRIVRAPGMGLQYLTTKEPTLDMIEVAITSFRLAMDGPGPAGEQAQTIEPGAQAPDDGNAREQEAAAQSLPA